MNRSVLAIDLIGYSDTAAKFVTTFGQEGLEMFEKRLMNIIETGIASTNRSLDEALIKRTGDGALLKFAAVASAVQCAVKIQLLSRKINLDSGVASFDFRIGIATGELASDPQSGEYSGITITRATRLESNCPSGSVLLDCETYEGLSGPLRLGIKGPSEVPGKRDEKFTCYVLPVEADHHASMPQPPSQSTISIGTAAANASVPPGNTASKSDGNEVAHVRFGAYLRRHYRDYEGHYLACRRSFDNHRRIICASVNLAWNSELSCLGFEEQQCNQCPNGELFRTSFTGAVHIPPSIGVIQLVSQNNGLVRMASLTLLRLHRSNTMIGTLAALAQPGVVGFRPAASPLALRKLDSQLPAELLGVHHESDDALGNMREYLGEAEDMFFSLSGGEGQHGNGGVVIPLGQRRPIG